MKQILKTTNHKGFINRLLGKQTISWNYHRNGMVYTGKGWYHSTSYRNVDRILSYVIGVPAFMITIVCAVGYSIWVGVL